MKLLTYQPASKLELLPASSVQMIDFQAQFLRSIAAAVGVTYEQLSADYDACRYSMVRQRYLAAKRFSDQVYDEWRLESQGIQRGLRP